MSSAPQGLGSLPPSWTLVPLKSVASYDVSNVDKHTHANELPVRLCNYTDVYKNERITLDMELMRATATPEEISKFHLQVDDVVITKDSETWNDIAVPALIAETEDDLVCGYHLAILRAESPALSGRYLLRAIQSRPVRLQLELASTGVTRCGLPKGAIGSAKIPLPEIGTQHVIADYLDCETAHINALVAEKERMLALLEEKRAALISRAVTRGLIPQAPTKPSGLDWLGDIPKHWEVRRGKFIFKRSSLPVREDDEILTCYRDGEVTLRKNRREDGFTNAILELGYQGIRSGQLVLHSMDAFAGAIGVSDSDGKCSPEYIICDPIENNANLFYFSTTLRLMALRGYIQAACTAVRERAPRIRFSHLANMLLPLPPLEEQEAIVDSICQLRESTYALEKALGDSIKLLKERRSTLITAAVKGALESVTQNK